MSYDYRYINKQVFENSVNYTLLIEDTDTGMVTRIEKCFKVIEQKIDDEFLRDEAKLEIEKLKNPIEIDNGQEPLIEFIPTEG